MIILVDIVMYGIGIIDLARDQTRAPISQRCVSLCASSWDTEPCIVFTHARVPFPNGTDGSHHIV
jgi:hypothetical protein